jgi:hypothetical protein
METLGGRGERLQLDVHGLEGHWRLTKYQRLMAAAEGGQGINGPRLLRGACIDSRPFSLPPRETSRMHPSIIPKVLRYNFETFLVGIS